MMMIVSKMFATGNTARKNPMTYLNFLGCSAHCQTKYAKQNTKQKKYRNRNMRLPSHWIILGAGMGNRTPLVSLEGFHFTTKLYPLRLLLRIGTVAGLEPATSIFIITLPSQTSNEPFRIPQSGFEPLIRQENSALPG